MNSKRFYHDDRKLIAVCGALVAAFVVLLACGRYAAYNDPAAVEVQQHETLHDVAWMLFELHRELDATVEACASHEFGLELAQERVERRFRTTSYRVDGADPRKTFEEALFVIAKKSLDGKPSHFEAVQEATIVLEAYFSSHSGRQQITFDQRTGKMLPSQRKRITSTIKEFLGYSPELADSPERCLEDWCDKGRKVSYALFPVWDDYVSSASPEEKKNVDELVKRLDLEKKHAEEMRSAAKSVDESDHIDDVLGSIARRRAMIIALKDKDAAAIKRLVLDAIDRRSSKVFNAELVAR